MAFKKINSTGPIVVVFLIVALCVSFSHVLVVCLAVFCSPCHLGYTLAYTGNDKSRKDLNNLNKSVNI